MSLNIPMIIQGGMGVGVSSYKLANAVASNGQLGVVAGTALAVTLVRKMSLGIDQKEIKDAFDRFPFKEMSKRIWQKYSQPSHKKLLNRFLGIQMYSLNQGKELTELTVIANFIEVYLAKKGHCGLVGINFLEKIQLPTLPSLYGAMLADVDYIIMGAGIPVKIPQILDDLSENKEVSLPLKIADEYLSEQVLMTFSPEEFGLGEKLHQLRRPQFLAIVSSTTLAQHLSRSSYGSPDGFIVESPIAGGHNAPPRGKYEKNEHGEPIYSIKDQVNIPTFVQIGLPFWLAGGFGSHEQLEYALSAGAEGIQVGTVFSLCDESGFDTSLKQRILKAVGLNKAKVFTDPLASPTGFPFKVVELEGTLGTPEVFNQRKKICDLGFLREAFRKKDGLIGYRCAAEPEEDYVSKGGKIEDTVNRKCLCNGLLASIGLGQIRKDGDAELPLVTSGDDLKNVLRFIKNGSWSYSALDVIKKILGSIKPINI